jgi:hypothetical protein
MLAVAVEAQHFITLAQALMVVLLEFIQIMMVIQQLLILAAVAAVAVQLLMVLTEVDQAAQEY